MRLDEIDPTLDRLCDARDRVRDNLLALEEDDNRKLLDESALEGETARRWAEASASLTLLWQCYAALEDVLERAHAMRAKRLSASQLVELENLLTGASIAVSSEDVPLAERALLDDTKVTARCTPDQLLTRMSAEFDVAKSVVTDVGGVWDALLPRLQDARRRLDDCAELARNLGQPEPAELEPSRRRVDALAARMMSDPLSASPDEIADVEASLERAQRAIDGLADLMSRTGDRLDDARRLLAELERAAQDGREAHDETLLKIAAPEVPEPVTVDPTLAAELERVAKLAADGDWSDASAALERWTAEATAQLDEANRVVGAIRAPIDARNELRGRLDAYRAKANRLGLLEDLADIHERASGALYTAPTDLVAAADLVGRYGRALTAERKVTP